MNELEKVIDAILLLTASTCEIRKTPNSPCYGKRFDLVKILRDKGTFSEVDEKFVLRALDRGV